MTAQQRAELLTEATEAVNNARNAVYDEPTVDFKRTAAMWTAYLGRHVEAHDVGLMLALVKISRLAATHDHRDSYVDLAGYAACAWDCAKPNGDGT